MKKFVCALIILIFLAFLAFEFQKSPSYIVLDVLEADKLYLDLNFNGLKEDNELVKLEGIQVVGGKTDEKTLENLDITEDEAKYIKKSAKKYMISNFLGEKVSLKMSSDNNSNLNKENKDVSRVETLGRVYFHGVDLAQILLIKGFALSDGENNPDVQNLYKILENPRGIKKNAKQLQNFRCKKSHLDFRKNPKNRALQRAKSRSSQVFRTSLVRKFGDVEIFLVNPNSNKMPSSSCGTEACRVLLKNIKNVKESIDFALYGLDRQDEILNALLEAKKRGVKIRGVVDSKADGTYVYADTAKLVKNFDVRADLSGANMHNKFFIFDNDKIFTGTMNISTTGTGGYNANTAVLIKNENVVRAFRSEFEQLYEGKFQGAKRDFSVQNINLGAAGEVDIYFSPAGNPLEKGILPFLRGARRQIYVSIFYLTNRMIIDELVAAKARGVDVRIIYDSVGANNMKALVALMRSKGLKLKVENWGGKNHEKNMVIDGKIFITGSANFSNSGMGKNDENILIFKNEYLAKFYLEYFLKLYDDLDEKYLKFTPRAESFESGNSCYDGLDNNFDGKIDKDDAGCKI